MAERGAAERGRPEPPACVLFDLDGVVTDTARVHRRAWGELFTDFLDRHGSPQPYTDRDYIEHIDGKARLDGVRSLLRSRQIGLPEEAPDGMDSVRSLGEDKNGAFLRLLDREGVQVFPDAVALLDALEARGVPRAIVSSSRNARAVLRAAGLEGRFADIVDGTVAAERGLAGKPAPDTFRYAAERLDADPSRSIVLEDAVSGVAAGRAGGFWVVGVDRTGADAELRSAGADELMTSLQSLV